MLRSIKNTLKRAEAAAVVEGMLDGLNNPILFSGSAREAAHHAIKLCWHEFSDICEGTQGERPHKASLAAMACLMGAINDKENKAAFMLILGDLLVEVTLKGDYKLSRTDHQLIGMAQGGLEKMMETEEDDLVAEISQLMSDTSM